MEVKIVNKKSSPALARWPSWPSGSLSEHARAHEEGVHHDALDCEERNGLCRVFYCHGWDCDQAADAGDPVHCPSQLVFLGRIFPSRVDGRYRTDEHDGKRDRDGDSWIVEDKQQVDPQASSS